MKTISPKRKRKVRDALVFLLEAADTKDMSKVKAFNDLDKEDQQFVTRLAESLIDLVDALLEGR